MNLRKILNAFTAGRAFGALALMCLPIAAARPAQAQWLDRQLVFAPLMLAMDVAYQSWLTGPLGGHAPTPGSFMATLDATRNPYTVVFASAKGYAIPGGAYSVSANRVIDAMSAQLPLFPGVSKGPVTLSGGYVLAYRAANAEHAKFMAADADAYAFENTTGSSVVITAFTHENANAILVGFAQTALPTHGPWHIGCYKEQYYIVDPETFVAQKTTIGCPH